MASLGLLGSASSAKTLTSSASKLKTLGSSLGNSASSSSSSVGHSGSFSSAPVTNNPNKLHAQDANDAWDIMTGQPVGTTSGKTISDDSVIGKVGNWLEETIGKPVAESRENITNEVQKVVSNGINSITGTPSGTGSSSDINSSPIDYLNADIAKHYGMNAETAYMEALSNTAHQREVADMIKAGLNPSVIYGSSGASINQVAESSDSSGSVNGSTTGKGLLKLVADIGLLAAFKSRGLYMMNSVNRAIDNILG